jgi:acyl-CoA ligase (AMP-forming) (exosortase A-associated)
MSTSLEFAVHHLLHNAARRDPEQVAIVDRGEQLTYRKLARRCDALAAALVDRAVGKSDRIAIYLDKSVDAVVAMLAASQAGAAFVNINPLLKPRQIQYILRDCNVRAIIGDADRLTALGHGPASLLFYTGETPPPVRTADSIEPLEQVIQDNDGRRFEQPVLENDLAAIIYTSGSTGLPKGVALSHHNLVVGAQIVSAYLQNTSDDRILAVLPFSFDYGLNQLTTALQIGATLVLQRSSLPGDLLRSLREHRITRLAGVPPLWPLLLQSRKSLKEQPLTDLRSITNSGGRIPAPHLEELRQLLPATKIYLMYGLTEAFRSTYLPPEEIDRGPDCIGRPIPNTEIWVLGPDGRECAPGEIGELVHRGPTVALGYWGKDDETRAVFRPSPFSPTELNHQEKVVYSGDLVRRDTNGYLYFIGRRDGLIKSQGYRVSPEEVEDLLLGCGIVREACAFGLPDPEAGMRIAAVVSLHEHRDGVVDDIRSYCFKHGPPYLVPQLIQTVEELPKTVSGKIDRKAVRDAFSMG